MAYCPQTACKTAFLGWPMRGILPVCCELPCGKKLCQTPLLLRTQTALALGRICTVRDVEHGRCAGEAWAAPGCQGWAGARPQVRRRRGRGASYSLRSRAQPRAYMPTSGKGFYCGGWIYKPSTYGLSIEFANRHSLRSNHSMPLSKAEIEYATGVIVLN